MKVISLLPHESERVIQAFPCFSCLSSEEWLRHDMRILQVPAALVMEQGHLFAHASFVLNGTVRISKIGPNGRELTLYRVRRGELCVVMMASILGELPYEATASVEEEAELLVVPSTVFKQWMERYKEVNQFIYRLFIRRMTAVTGLIEELAFQPIDARIAELLLYRSSADSVSLRVTHEELAVELGTAREVVSRKLKQFEKEGLLELGRGTIRNIQREALRRQFPPSM